MTGTIAGIAHKFVKENAEAAGMPVKNWQRLSAQDRREILEHEVQLKALIKTTEANIIEIGRRLDAVKAKLFHGEFGPWLKKNFPVISPAKAQTLISISRAFHGIGTDSTLIPESALKLLSLTYVPVEVREKAVERAKKGELISNRKARQMITESGVREFEGVCIKRAPDDPRLDAKKMMRKKLVGQYKSLGATITEEVETSAGTADFMTSGAIFEVLPCSGIDAAMCALGRVLVYRQLINPNLKAVIIASEKSAASSIKDVAIALGVSVQIQGEEL